MKANLCASLMDMLEESILTEYLILQGAECLQSSELVETMILYSSVLRT